MINKEFGNWRHVLYFVIVTFNDLFQIMWYNYPQLISKNGIKAAHLATLMTFMREYNTEKAEDGLYSFQDFSIVSE